MSSPRPYTPFPFNVTATSPLFHLSPVASNTSLGWVPSCTTPDCIPTANWSTSATNSTLSFQYWGAGVAFDGDAQGEMSIQLLDDGAEALWNPVGDTLFNLQGKINDDLYQRNVTIKVLAASPEARLTITRARVNGSSYGDYHWTASRWIVPSSDDRLEYSGFAPQTSEDQGESSIVFASSHAGDTAEMQFNGSTFIMYGPCGPTNGLMRVTIDDQQYVVNTSKPFVSNDCLLFQARGFPVHNLHQLLIENVDGGSLSISRFEFFKVWPYRSTGTRTGMRIAIAASVTVVGIVVCVVAIIVYARKKAREKLDAERSRESIISR